MKEKLKKKLKVKDEVDWVPSVPQQSPEVIEPPVKLEPPPFISIPELAERAAAMKEQPPTVQPLKIKVQT